MFFFLFSFVMVSSFKCKKQIYTQTHNQNKKKPGDTNLNFRKKNKQTKLGNESKNLFGSRRSAFHR